MTRLFVVITLMSITFILFYGCKSNPPKPLEVTKSTETTAFSSPSTTSSTSPSSQTTAPSTESAPTEEGSDPTQASSSITEEISTTSEASGTDQDANETQSTTVMTEATDPAAQTATLTILDEESVFKPNGVVIVQLKNPYDTIIETSDEYNAYILKSDVWEHVYLDVITKAGLFVIQPNESQDFAIPQYPDANPLTTGKYKITKVIDVNGKQQTLEVEFEIE